MKADNYVSILGRPQKRRAEALSINRSLERFSEDRPASIGVAKVNHSVNQCMDESLDCVWHPVSDGRNEFGIDDEGMFERYDWHGLKMRELDPV